MKDIKTFRILAGIGFIPLLSGLPWFYIGKIGKGLVYTATVGWCWIGSVITLLKAGEIVDIYNAKRGYINTSRRDG